MSKQFLSSFGETNYPGKATELSAEKKEKKELFDNVAESGSDYNKIRAAENRGPQHTENTYNSAETEEAIISSARDFKTAENIVGENQDEESIINAIDEKMKTGEASLAVIDSYGYVEIIEKIFSSAQAKGDIKEMDDILDRTSLFIKQYQKLLGRKLGEDEEKERVEAMFKEIVGEVSYIKDGDQERLELLSDFKDPRNARPGAYTGKKIYYAANDRVSKGFLSQAEADRDAANRAEKTRNKGKNKGNNEGYKKTIFSGIVRELKAFNPLTKKMESIDQKKSN